MTDRMVIEEIWADRFGGLRDTLVPLGSGGFVVVAGLNESGKTSLSELMNWLLVGPSGNAESAQRFGDPGEQIGGRLSGTLRDQMFRATGDFKVLKSGAPNDGGLEVTFGSQQLDADGWRDRLSGIDAAMLHAVYLMWGADLHDGDNVMAEIEEAALGGMPGSRNVGTLTGELQEEVRLLLTSRAAGADSFRKLQGLVKDCHGEMKTIRMRADEYADLQRDRAEIQSNVEQLDARKVELVGHIAARDALLAVVDERGQLREVRADLENLEAVPEPWRSLLVAPDSLADAAEGIKTADREVARSTDELQSACETAGLTADEVSSVTVGLPDVSAVARIGQQLRTAQEDLRDTEGDLRERRADLDRQQGDLDRALVACQGLTEEKLRGVALASSDYAAISTKIALWEDAADKAELVRAEVGQREAQQSQSAGNAQRAHEAWERFGADCTAQEWLRRGGTSAAAPTSGGRGSDLWIFAVAAAVSVGSSFVLPRIAWSIVTVGAFLFAFFVQRSGWGRGGDNSDGENSDVSETPSEAARDAAEEVLASEGLVDEADRALAAARRDLVAAETLRENAARAAKDRAQASGVTFLFDHTASKTHLDAVNVAVGALGKFDSSSSAMSRAEADLEKQQRQATDFGAEIRSALDSCGVPGRVQVEDAPGMIERFERVATARQAVESAQAEHEAALEQYVVLTTPVADEVDGWSHSAVVDRCRELAAAVAEREKLEVRETDLSRLIDTTMGGNEGAREVQREGHSKEALELQNAQFRGQLTELDTERSELQKEFGAQGKLLEQIAQESKLARLSVDAGALEDASNDRVIDAAAHSVALTLLTEVAEEQRQANQPALVKRASELLATVQSEWERILVTQDGSTTEVSVRGSDGAEVSAHQLSTGARALVYLSLRLAMADQDATERGFRFPIICDDPLVHIDDRRARMVLPLLAQAAESGHQVVLFTCHRRTVKAAEAVGANIVPLDGGID